jgi:CRP/FNR family cyclic AMP-dependent transcriptional regulator
LRTVPLFAGFPDEQLRLLVSAVNRRNVPRGTIVIVEGDPTDSLYIIISGASRS